MLLSAATFLEPLLEVPISLPCQVLLKTGKGYNLRLYSLPAKQVSHSRSNLLT